MASFSPSQGPPPCAHKSVSRCMLNVPGCCACSDRRPHTQSYNMYVDGVGDVPQATRWTYYCDRCKAFWEFQIRRAGISASLSRIPDFPRSSPLDTPRSPRRTIASAFSQMEHYPPNPNRSHRPLLRLARVSREETPPSSPASLGDRMHRQTSLSISRARGATVSTPSSPGIPESTNSIDNLRRMQRPRSLSISRVGDVAVETPPSPVSPATIQDDIIRQQQRLQYLQDAASGLQHSNTSSEGSMDAQASTTGTTDLELPVQSRNNLISFVESRAHITDLGNQLDRLHAQILGSRNAASTRELQRNEIERHRWSTQRGAQVLIRPLPPRGSQVPARPGRREASSIHDGAERTWSPVASITSATTDNNSSVSLEAQGSQTPDRVLPQPVLEPQSQSGQSTQTNSPQQPDRTQPIWTLANSVQDIETELAHLSEGAARRSAELASLSQQLERQTRQYAAQRNAPEQGENYDHNDILGRASEGLRRLRELRERREWGERGEQQEHMRRVWGNVEDEDYVSPVSTLFQSSWEPYDRRQQAEQEGRRPSPASVWFPDPDAPVPGSVRTAMGSATIPDPHRTAIDLATAANEASTLLQNFRENLEGDTITPDQQILIDRAVDGILQMRREVRSRARTNSRRPRRSRGGRAAWEPPKGLDDDDSRPPPLGTEAMMIDCECKVCFGQIADTVLLPCSHLVLCGWCADQMGIRKLSEFSPRPVQCPICRTNVVDRIKVFRG